MTISKNAYIPYLSACQKWKIILSYLGEPSENLASIYCNIFLKVAFKIKNNTLGKIINKNNSRTDQTKKNWRFELSSGWSAKIYNVHFGGTVSEGTIEDLNTYVKITSISINTLHLIICPIRDKGNKLNIV